MCSEIKFATLRGPSASLPLARLYEAMPFLRSEYRCTKNGNSCTFRSKATWTEADSATADAWHNARAIKCMNWGAAPVFENTPADLRFQWFTTRGSPILPAMTSSLLFAFVLSSISRYRANLAADLEQSKLNLLIEVFRAEADGLMVPAFRNLLYREQLGILAPYSL